MPLFGGIEAGGTKFVCAVGSGPHDLRVAAPFPTTTPAATITRAIEFFQQQSEPIAAIGIGAFGPVDPEPSSVTYGYITSTPKPGWQQTDLGGQVARAVGVPMAFDTDVNAAALGEHRWGAAQDVDTMLYLTVGTGIGGGALVHGHLLHGLLHPEMGHIRVPHNWQDDPFAGVCAFHGDCLEGLAAGPAIERRWERRGEMLSPEHPAWALEAHYLALGLVSYICTLAPQRIILGGGVMQQDFLFPLIREKVQSLLNGYVQVPAILEQINTYIIPPGLGKNAGVLGAIALAQQAWDATASP
jgi:fructokinase